jgi:hypothetical protein
VSTLGRLGEFLGGFFTEFRFGLVFQDLKLWALLACLHALFASYPFGRQFHNLSLRSFLLFQTDLIRDYRDIPDL